MENRVVCAVTDLEATVLNYVERPLPNAPDPATVADFLTQIVVYALYDADISREKVRGVGVGLAGVINSDAGIVHYSPFFHWQDIPLAKMVSERLSLPVYLENDVNTLTITEQLFGPGHGVANFVVMTIGRGIGLGMVMNHQLYRGHKGGVGELGHITLVADGPACDCGKRGCLEAFAADPAMLRLVEDAIAQGADTSLTAPATIAAVKQAAAQGDPLACDILAQSGYYLGLGLSSVVNLFCPSLIIISGEGVTAGSQRLDAMFETLQANTFNGLLDDVDIQIKPADDQAWARGASGLVVGKIFESPLTETESAVEAH